MGPASSFENWVRGELEVLIAPDSELMQVELKVSSTVLRKANGTSDGAVSSTRIPDPV